MDFNGEKTEQPTARKLEEASRNGQFPRSAEVQTIFVMTGAMLAPAAQLTNRWWYRTGHLEPNRVPGDPIWDGTNPRASASVDGRHAPVWR